MDDEQRIKVEISTGLVMLAGALGKKDKYIRRWNVRALAMSFTNMIRL
jgi:hypothetical protein